MIKDEMKYIIDFLEVLEFEKHYSVHTILNYRKDLISFLNYIKEVGINELKSVEYSDIRIYLNVLYEKNYSNKTISRHISSLKSFFKYLKKIEVVSNNPMILVSNPKSEKKLPKFLAYKELEEIVTAYDENTLIGARNSLILELLYSTGIRVSELINIKISDIDNLKKEIIILGKGNKERIVLYGKRCEYLIDNYLNKYYPTLNKKNSIYLLLGIHGGKINDREVRKIIDEAVRKTGLKMHISPHVLRHTFATHMLNEGADLKSVQQLLGHESLSTTTIYTHISNERLRNVYLHSHPRAR